MNIPATKIQSKESVTNSLSKMEADEVRNLIPS